MGTLPNRTPVMELRGPTSDTFELRVVGYQFAQMTDDFCECNLLCIHTRASIGGRVWQTVHPALLTWEVLELADWLDAISVAPPAKPELAFHVPNLWFELQSWGEERTRFRVYFEREHRPVWFESSDEIGEAWAELECTPEELNDWATHLRWQLEKFPPRGRARSQSRSFP